MTENPVLQEALYEKRSNQGLQGARGCVTVVVKTGEILALAGMGVLLLNNLGRRRVKQSKPPAARGGLARFLAYGDFVALGLILAGLVVMYLQK